MSRPKRIRFGDNRQPGQRFPIVQEVAYKCVRGRTVSAAGSGKTLEMSSAELTFTTEEVLRLKQKVEVTVNWPALLDQTCPMKLVIRGHVVRSAIGIASVSIESYDFRTRAASPIAGPFARVMQESGFGSGAGGGMRAVVMRNLTLHPVFDDTARPGLAGFGATTPLKITDSLTVAAR